MRLGQLARKLEVKPSEIAEFLNSKHQLEISVHPNSKIPDEFVEEVKSHFYVEPIIEEVIENVEKTVINDIAEPEPNSDSVETAELPALEKSDNNTTILQANEEIIKPVIKEVIPEALSEENVSNEDLEEKEPNSESSEWENVEFISEEVKSQAETIKVPKIDLEGLKVVGKIDLPKSKAEVEAEESSDSDEENIGEETAEKENDLDTAPIKVSKPMRKAPRSKRPEKRKYTEKEKAEQRERKKLDAHIQLLKDQKEAKKKAHYAKIQEKQNKKVNPSKKKKKKAVTKIDAPKKLNKKSKEVAPTSFWGKFKKWLNDS